MNKIEVAQALTSNANVQGWIDSLLRTNAHTWQRGEAMQGLAGAVKLAIGTENAVEIEVTAPRRDSAIIINGDRFPVRMFR